MADTDELAISDQVLLVDVAREAIANHLARGSTPTTKATRAAERATLQAQMGAFVSLHTIEDGQLRGCIGTMSGDKALYETVAEMAVQAATADTRFAPLASRELRNVEIEVSVLTPMRPIDPSEVEVGKHGLFIHKGRYRGVLLPQVPQQYGWSREEFLDQTCKKAGLPAGAWKDEDTYVLAFTAQVFSERELIEGGHIT